MNCSAGVCSPTAKEAVLNVNDLETMLASADVTVMSDSQALDINFKSAFQWTSSSTLSLTSYRSITFEKPILVMGTGSMAITVNTGRNLAYWDYLTFSNRAHVEFRQDDQSHFVLDGHEYCLVHNIKTMIKLLSHRHACHSFALARSYDAHKDGTYLGSPLSFIGAFEGLGNTISNLSISSSTDGDTVGFASNGGGIIRDFGLLSVSIAATGKNDTVGALVGTYSDYNNGPFVHCYATGSIFAGDGAVAGGLVGSFGGFALLVRSAANVAVAVGNNGYAGGLVGSNYDGFIEQTYANGMVTGGDGAIAGGLVGENASPDWYRGIFDSYSTARVSSGNSASSGGLVGLQSSISGNSAAHVYWSYSVGVVSAGSASLIGGLVGDDQLPPGFLLNTYWDVDTSGISDPHQGAGNIPDDQGITGLTDAQLKSGRPAGFDPNIWAESPGINNGYPYLIDNPPK